MQGMYSRPLCHLPDLRKGMLFKVLTTWGAPDLPQGGLLLS